MSGDKATGRRLKVYGGYICYPSGQRRTIVAAPCAAMAHAALIGLPGGYMSLHHFRQYWCVSGNAQEVETATTNPGVVFRATDQHASKFVRAESNVKTFQSEEAQIGAPRSLG